MPPGLVAASLEKVGLSIYCSMLKRYSDDLHKTALMRVCHARKQTQYSTHHG